MSEITTSPKTQISQHAWNPNWVVSPVESRMPRTGFYSLSYAAQENDLSNAVKSLRSQKLGGYITIREACRRLVVSRSMIYGISKLRNWQRILTPERDLYFLEADVMAAFDERVGTAKYCAPEPEEIIVSAAPSGYRNVESIRQQYQVSSFTVYQAADRHFWRRALVSKRVFFNHEDVQSYFEPVLARGYSLAEAAAYLGIQVEQVALAARLNGWRRMPGNRFRASDVERRDAAQGVEDYLSLNDVVVRLGLRRAHLIKVWKERRWRIIYMRIGEFKMIFVCREDVERYALENDSDRYPTDYYTTNDIRQALNVSRQRVGQLAQMYGWRRFYPSSRHVLYLRVDVDVFLANRLEMTKLCI